MRTYETVFILDPDLSEEDTDKATKRIQTVIEGQKGKIVLWDRWGKRKLAYRVKKKAKGNYIRIVYYGEPRIVTIIERNLRIMEDVLKFLTIVLADKEIDVTIEEKKEERESTPEAASLPGAAPLPKAAESPPEEEGGDIPPETTEEAAASTEEPKAETNE